MAKNKKRKSKARSPNQKRAPAAAASRPAARTDSSGPRAGAASKPSASAKASPARASSGSRQKAGLSGLQLVLFALCGAGVLLTVYLSYVAMFGDHPAYCSAGSGCDIVQSSRWSTLLGLPMATWGLLTYLAITFFAWQSLKRPSRWKSAFFLAVCGVGISTFLTVVSVTEIGATCGYCLTSYGIITAIMVVLALLKPASPATAEWSRTLPAPVIAAVVIVAGLQFHFSGFFDPSAGPERPGLRDLALHLEESGAKFYGAYWCPRCQEQKALFEASVDRLPYVECSPQGQGGPQAAACALKGIRDYPTWVIKDRRYVGVQSVDALAKYSGYRPRTGPAESVAAN